jgi:hypothetical protein
MKIPPICCSAARALRAIPKAKPVATLYAQIASVQHQIRQAEADGLPTDQLERLLSDVQSRLSSTLAGVSEPADAAQATAEMVPEPTEDLRDTGTSDPFDPFANSDSLSSPPPPSSCGSRLDVRG